MSKIHHLVVHTCLTIFFLRVKIILDEKNIELKRKHEPNSMQDWSLTEIYRCLVNIKANYYEIVCS